MSIYIQYISRNMHTVFALLCFVVVIHWLIFPCPSGLLHWHCGNLTIVPVPAKQPWWIWINTSCEFIMNECITTTKQSTTKRCAFFWGYTVYGITNAPADISAHTGTWTSTGLVLTKALAVFLSIYRYENFTQHEMVSTYLRLIHIHYHRNCEFTAILTKSHLRHWPIND